MDVPGGLTVFGIAWLAANTIAFFVYAYDKYLAQHNGWRTSEARLLALAFAAPFGAYAAMLLFRHKTKKPLFFLVPLFCCLQVILLTGFLVLA